MAGTCQRFVVHTISNSDMQELHNTPAPYSRGWLNIVELFYNRYGVQPNRIVNDNLNWEAVLTDLVDGGYVSLEKAITKKRFKGEDLEEGYEWMLAEISEGLMVEIVQCNKQEGDVSLFFTPNQEAELIDKLCVLIRKHVTTSKTRSIHLLFRGSFNNIELEEMELKHQALDCKKQYNDDFLPISEVILQRLQKPNDKGLVLLHGKPGTGKTSYLRHLTSVVKKKFIFITPSLATEIASPEFIGTLIDNPNSILIIEDAEAIIKKREHGLNNAVSNLLNLSDGLLSDCLNIQVICTFNCGLSEIDPALLRKGRIIAEYEFKELDAKKAQALSNGLGFNGKITTPMTLAEIYGQKEMDFVKEVGRIGFGISQN